MPDIVFPGPDADVPGYLAVPTGTGPWPGVVVVHEIFGLNDDIRSHADRLAGDGYLALAPDLMANGRTWQCLRSMFADLRRGSGPALDTIDAARALLAARPDCTGRVGVIGFCMGGGFALLAAPRYDFAAASVNYGPVPKDAESVLAGACPVIASYGGKDRAMSRHADRLDAALTRLGVEHEITRYPDAGHSFLNQHNGIAFTVLEKVSGAGYHGPSATNAQQRIRTFFATHLGAPEAG